MNIRCIVIEDELPAQALLKEYISRLAFLDLQGTFNTVSQAINSINDGKIDLIFLDVKLPGASGLDLLRANPGMSVILTTAFGQHAVESFDLGVVDYLLKPFSFERFSTAVDRYLKIARPDAGDQPSSKSTRSFMFIKSNKRMVKVFHDDILFFEAQKNYLLVQTKGASYMTYHSISQMEERLPASKFLRLHRSFIVSVDQIDQFNSTMVVIGSREIPIGKNYSEASLAALSRIAGGKQTL